MLSYSNGANDNFKGVATLFGSGDTSYTTALWWASICTFLGVICSVFFAEALIKSFSGKGLVPDEVVLSELFIASVALAAGLTVTLATRIGMPISTTHGLIGALVGSGLMASFSELDLSQLGKTFLLPLILSPFIAVLLGYIVTRIIGTGHSLQRTSSGLKRAVHFTTGGAVCFARGLNDAPKIAGMLVIVHLSDIRYGMLAIGGMMVIGGAIHSRKIASTMGEKMAHISINQGMSASVVTAVLVGLASFTGLPVSTTHVSVGSIYGVSLVSKSQNNKVFKEIALSWILTMPVGLIISVTTYFLLGFLIRS